MGQRLLFSTLSFLVVQGLVVLRASPGLAEVARSEPESSPQSAARTESTSSEGASEKPSAASGAQEDESDGPALSDVDRAKTAFDDGLGAFQKGDYQTACAHFRTSYELDPLAGVMFTLATCESRAQRIHTAHELYEKFLSQVAELPEEQAQTHAVRIDVAKQELEKLKVEIPHLRIQMHADKQSGGRITIDGVQLTEAQLDTRLPFNPGEHLVALSVAGQLAEQRRVFLSPRDDVLLGMGRPTPREEQADAPTSQPKTKAPPPRASVSPWVYVTGTTAIAGLALGTGFGISTLNASSDVRCNGRDCEDEDALDDVQSAQSQALVSTVSFIIGGVALAGTVALAAYPHFQLDVGETAALSLRPNGIDVRGVF